MQIAICFIKRPACLMWVLVAVQVMNGYLSARVFRRVLKEIWMGLLFCMEEFALNKDEVSNAVDVRRLVLRIVGRYYWRNIVVSME
jgi:hypothetical protein